MKKIIISLGVVAVIITAFIALNKPNSKTTVYSDNSEPSSNVSLENGQQIITVDAKGGYTPRTTIAKADTPTILRVRTSGTFDCSSALRIPAIKYSKNLPPTGTTDIELPKQSAGTTLKALCSMGMYNFSIQFKG
jgi:plastocyanin domain-containing protein